ADRILVDLAVKNHLISEAEGQECLQEAASAAQDVGDVLLRKRYVKEKHLESLRRKLSKIMAEGGGEVAAPAPAGPGPSAPLPAPSAADATFVTPPPSAIPDLLSGNGALVLFGQLAVDRKLVTQDDVDRALRLQEQL